VTTARETASLLALSVPITEAPAALGTRIISQAQREAGRETVEIRAESGTGFFGRFGFALPAAGGMFAGATAAVLAFALVVQGDLNDLRSENEALETQLQASTFQLEQDLQQADSELEGQQAIVDVLTDDSRQEVAMHSTRSNTPAEAEYAWSPSALAGYLNCQGLPKLPPGEVYQLWFTVDGEDYPVQQFVVSDGSCQVAVDLAALGELPTGIGLSVESALSVVDRPSRGWLLYAGIGDAEE
jgi:hypothetical protein